MQPKYKALTQRVGQGGDGVGQRALVVAEPGGGRFGRDEHDERVGAGGHNLAQHNGGLAGLGLRQVRAGQPDHGPNAVEPAADQNLMKKYRMKVDFYKKLNCDKSVKLRS